MMMDNNNMRVSKINKRYGRDGRKCASAFVVNGVLYRDCVIMKSPDGKN